MIPPGKPPAARLGVSLGEVFTTFLLIGVTSIGGGVVAYLHSGLVTKKRWVDDDDFVRMVSISQTLPGLNATNMAVLVGDRLRGGPGAFVAILGICLPGAVIMALVAVVYGIHGERPVAGAMLHGIAAAATGLVFAVTAALGRKAVRRARDVALVAAAVLGLNVLHLPVPVVLIGLGAVAIWWYRPNVKGKEPPGDEAASGADPRVRVPVAPDRRRRDGGIP